MDDVLVAAQNHAASLQSFLDGYRERSIPDNLPARLSTIDKVALSIESASSASVDDAIAIVSDRISLLDVEK
jgi:hypothetical protein